MSPSFDFITSLSIITPFPVSDLVKLSSVTNLGVLEIINTTGPRGSKTPPELFHHGIGDRLVRTWCLAAINDGAFQVLRVLKLWNHEDLTSKSLVYLNSFPALAVYDVRGCCFELDAKVHPRQLGWKPTMEMNILGLFEAVCLERIALLQDSPGTKSQAQSKPSVNRLQGEIMVRRIPRSEVREFLCHREVLAAEKLSVEVAVKSNAQANFKQSEDSYSKIASKNIRQSVLGSQVSTKSKTPHTRDNPSNAIYARVGELRNDSDLAVAGIPLGDQLVVGDELVSSIPMMTLCLGGTGRSMQPLPGRGAYKSFYNSTRSESAMSYLDYHLQSNSAIWDSRSLCFIRIKALQGLATRSQAESIREAEAQLPLPSALNSTSRQAAPGKRQGAGIMRNKKRKLDDVLSSFT